MLDLEKLASAPSPPRVHDPGVERAIADSVAYLSSDTALRSIELDPYWPKWHSPWWHMLLLFELGEARQIDQRAVTAMVKRVDRLLHFFPLRPEEAPGADLSRDAACHCALGSIVQVFSACGVDVDRALPWVTPWFVRYQMADGGLTCDDTAYLVTGECPSSMVGTIAPLEAMLEGAVVGSQRRAFVDRAAAFLLARELTKGSPTVHNAAERVSAEAWPALSFPRFYFYDVLRGLSALVRWAENTRSEVPAQTLEPVIARLLTRWPDGVVCVERQAFAGKTTLIPTLDRSPGPREPTSTFPLLEVVSVVGAASETLTRQWTNARAGLLRLSAAGLLTG